MRTPRIRASAAGSRAVAYNTSAAESPAELSITGRPATRWVRDQKTPSPAAVRFALAIPGVELVANLRLEDARRALVELTAAIEAASGPVVDDWNDRATEAAREAAALSTVEAAALEAESNGGDE